MNIGFDAKRAFQNRTGLGNYSRTLIRSLAETYPQHQYLLFAPKTKPLFRPPAGMRAVLPVKAHHRWLKSVWRSRWMVRDLQRQQVDVFHGLSAELPFGIHRTGIKTAVTMHDLIFERYPRQYNPVDVLTYRKKARYACEHASRVIAISEQTKADLVQFYSTPANRISVCYQACDPAFETLHPQEAITAMLRQYGLPARYFLYVGSVIERKNLLRIAEALHLLKDRLNIPLVVLGDGRQYKEKVKQFLRQKGLEQQVIWLNEVAGFAFKDLPALYQGATALLYPSLFEGFGIPILEALWSRTPVITSQGSCFLETGGNAALYVDPLNPAAIADAMEQVSENGTLVEGMKEKGIAHAQNFTIHKCAAAVMNVYENL
ncbi:glycosyltransferase family 4 protein [Chitinophaga alhagiae]|uniref:glycosyltransferase family 4 protein n=1 Tax=Chitinophaga alhagiae TaxID=2203219 RepID=UPI000E5B82B8|nr:glycosyltransferase family 1 protein [Chitinophaga alhagiae]